MSSTLLKFCVSTGLFLLSPTQLSAQNNDKIDWESLSRVEAKVNVSIDEVYEALFDKDRAFLQKILNYSKKRGFSSLQKRLTKDISELERQCERLDSNSSHQDCQYELKLRKEELQNFELALQLSDHPDHLSKKLYLAAAIYFDHLLYESLENRYRKTFRQCEGESSTACERSQKVLQKFAEASTDFLLFAKSQANQETLQAERLRKKVQNSEYLTLD